MCRFRLNLFNEVIATIAQNIFSKTVYCKLTLIINHYEKDFFNRHLAAHFWISYNK